MNRSKELINKEKYYQSWNISKKYTQILMNHERNDENLDMCFDIHKQFIHELINKGLDISGKKNYIRCWDTLLNTLLNNPKILVQRNALKLLHQTNIQRSYQK